MSGFEVVGVLLGSFPLIISALEHWRESADVVENWFQIKQKYKKCRREMRIQEEFFRQNIEHYLLPLVVDEDELDVLISEPCGPRWKDPALEMRLRSRLPKAYDLYLETIEELAAVMQKLKEELGAGKLDVNLESLQPGKPSVTRGRKARLEFEAQRIKFSFSQTARSKLFAEMAHLNGQLRDLLVSQERNYELVEKRASREESGLSKGLLDFWRHANRIFKLLQKAWCCSCQFYHGANLALRHRKSPDVDLRILFQFSETNIAPSPWTWQETRIRILETGRGNALTHGKALATVHQNASLKSQPLSFRPHGDASQKAFSAEYSVASSISSNSNPASTLKLKSKVSWEVRSPALTVTEIASAETDQITNLCSLIANSDAGQSCFGCLKEDDHHYTVVPLLRQIDAPDRRQFVSLETLIGDSSGVRLTRRIRYFTALTIASSYLQLHSTPWLGGEWSKKDVRFLSSSPACDGIMTEEPYISCRFAEPNSTNASNETFGSRPFLTLGILLLELCFGMALEQHETRRKLGKGDSQIAMYLDLAAALQWSEEVLEEAGPKYAGAVKWCLEKVGTVSQGGGWRHEFLREVVEPLQSCTESLEVVY